MKIKKKIVSLFLFFGYGLHTLKSIHPSDKAIYLSVDWKDVMVTNHSLSDLLKPTV